MALLFRRSVSRALRINDFLWYVNSRSSRRCEMFSRRNFYFYFFRFRGKSLLVYYSNTRFRRFRVRFISHFRTLIIISSWNFIRGFFCFLFSRTIRNIIYTRFRIRTVRYCTRRGGGWKIINGVITIIFPRGVLFSPQINIPTYYLRTE